MSAPTPQPKRRPWGVIMLCGVIAALFAWLIFGIERPRSIQQSAYGLNGLGHWVAADGVPTRRFVGGGQLSADGIGLRVLPLFDDDLDRTNLPFFVTAGNEGDADALTAQERSDQRFLNAEIRPMERRVLATKIETLPTLVILPKWRDGVRLKGLLHRDFLTHLDIEPVGVSQDETAVLDGRDIAREESVDEESVEDSEVTQQSQSGETALERFEDFDFEGERLIARNIRLPSVLAVTDPVTELQSIRVSGQFGGSVQLAAPQFARAGPDCRALVGEDDRGLVFECTARKIRYWVVSDPDLLNNHGLTQADNQVFARALINRLRGKGAVLIDYSTTNWLQTQERGPRLAELLRVFEPPFLWIWLALLGLFVLALWRGSVRDGPLRKPFVEGYSAARRAIFTAQARLLRATRRDGALLRALAETRAATLCDLMLGRDDRAGGSRTDRMIAQVRRRDGELGSRLAQILTHIAALPDRIGPDVAASALNDLETVYQEARALL